MGVNDTLEQLRAAQAYAVELEAKVAELEGADNERVARLMAYVTPLGYGWALALVEAETRLLEARDARNSDEQRCRAEGWDAAVAAIQFDDGTPVELVAVVNPYREGL